MRAAPPGPARRAAAAQSVEKPQRPLGSSTDRALGGTNVEKPGARCGSSTFCAPEWDRLDDGQNRCGSSKAKPRQMRSTSRAGR